MTSKTAKLLLLGNNLKKARKQRGLSQNALAEILDISREHLAKVETAKRTVSLSLLFEICDNLNVSEKDLFNFDD